MKYKSFDLLNIILLTRTKALFNNLLMTRLVKEQPTT